jgi:hypothetical protein
MNVDPISNDFNPMVASIEFVGWIKEILELDYGRFQIVIFFCNWVVVNYEGFVAIVKCDEHGFIIMNFKHLIPLLVE